MVGGYACNNLIDHATSVYGPLTAGGLHTEVGETEAFFGRTPLPSVRHEIAIYPQAVGGEGDSSVARDYAHQDCALVEARARA